MRIRTITDKFVDLRSCKGAHTIAEWDSEREVMVLRHKWSGNFIAEIFDYQNSKNYRLRLHPPHGRDGYIAHNNRLSWVLFSVQSSIREVDNFNRYFTNIHYGQKLHDSELNLSVEIRRPVELVIKNGRMTLDYDVLEAGAYPDEVKTPTTTVVEANSNIQELDNQLTTILAGV